MMGEEDLAVSFAGRRSSEVTTGKAILGQYLPQRIVEGVLVKAAAGCA